MQHYDTWIFEAMNYDSAEKNVKTCINIHVQITTECVICEQNEMRHDC